MTIEAKIIADSISEADVRLITFQLTYPRFIHAEFMTHRVFSRNASSSRAIPVAKMLEQVRTNPAMPIHWGKNQPGMQAAEQIQHVEHAKDLWIHAAKEAAKKAELMMEAGLHKQVINRILEPFQHIHVIVTATEWENFFRLRKHPAAQPEIQRLATVMHEAREASTPRLLKNNQWHLPYITDEELSQKDPSILRLISAARCARVSYLKHDGTQATFEEELELFNQLVTRPYTDKRGNYYPYSDPIHASPTEHQATPDMLVSNNGFHDQWEFPDLHGNFYGWVQHRKLLETNQI